MMQRIAARGRRNSLLVIILLAPFACAPRASRSGEATVPTTSGGSAESPETLEPPPAQPAPDAPFPFITHRRLNNGLAIDVIERRAHPLIELRLVVRSGTATDGDLPGVALVSGEMLKAGGAGRLDARQLVEKAERLGTDLSVTTDRDSTQIALSVTSADLDDALEVLSAVVLSPRFARVEFEKLRRRESERVKSAARGDPGWAASMVLYQRLFTLPSGVHPYARYDVLPSQIEKVRLADCRAWHAAHFVPSNSNLVVVGDVTPDRVLRAAARWLDSWSGSPAPEPHYPLPLRERGLHVYVVDRPGSTQARVDVALLGPERHDPVWPALSVVNQILGGGVAGRLFMDVREKRSLAYSTGSSLATVAVGPVPIILSAGTQTAKVRQAVEALLENLRAIASQSPSELEVQRAKAFLADSFVFQLETVGSLASLAAALDVLKLPDDYYDRYRGDVRALGMPQVAAAARQQLGQTPIVVVAGDARVLVPQLASVAPVTVLDAEAELAPSRSNGW